ncbi:MAG: O-antigen ligase family protein [Planctomycetota bacterium]
MILRLFQFLTLWGLVSALWAHAWMTSVSAAAVDQRVHWGLAWCSVGAAIGLVLAASLRRRRRTAWAGLGATRLGLCLVAVALCANGMAHVSADTSVRVLREEVPPFLGLLYPAIACITPLLLSRGATNRDDAWLGVLFVVAATTLGGSVLFLEPPTAAWLGMLALSLALDKQHLCPPRRALTALAALFVAILLVSSRFGHDPFSSWPSVQWLIGLSALAAAVAARPRDERAWRDLIATSVLAATVIALCGVAVTAYLADTIGTRPALRSRIVLFRQHPNFLAPYYGLHGILALGLAWGAKPRRVAWMAAALLLAASTLGTDSNTGITATVAALAAFGALLWLGRLAVRVPGRALLAAFVVLTVLPILALFLGGGEFVTARIGRFEQSLDFRLDAWTNALSVIRRHPVLGVGPNTFLAFERFQPGSRFFNAAEAPHPHNVLLYVGQAGGLAALAVFGAWLIALAIALWKRLAEDAPRIARPLVAAVAAGLLGLIGANQFDLGLSLLSVAPAPLFLFTGLLAARTTEVTGPPRAWPALAWPLGLGLVLWTTGVAPLRALTAVEQARLLSYEAGQSEDREALMAAARAAAQRALEHDALTPDAHELLARWHEQTPGGFAAARDVLLDRIARSPANGTGHGLLAALYMRQGLDEEAWTELDRALADPQGNADTQRDRAARIGCVARLGQRSRAFTLLVDALALDIALLAQLPWMDAEQPPHRLAVGGPTPQPPIELVEALELLFKRLSTSWRAQVHVPRANWMDLYKAFRVADQDERAGELLDWLELEGVAEVEDWTLAAERGELALSAGETQTAIGHFERAHALSGNPFYQGRAALARGEGGDDARATEQAAAALAATGEILDMPTAFRDNLYAQSHSLVETGRPVEAADVLRRTLLFQDDALERVKLWERIGELSLAGGRPEACVQALGDALELLAARPYPWTSLRLDLVDTLPARIARTFVAACRAQGLPPRRQLHAAWDLPQYFSSRQGPSLFRIGFAMEAGLADHLLRETELQLLADPTNQPARWAHLVALEANGRHTELSMAMRNLAESFAEVASAERLLQQLATEFGTTPESAETWVQGGFLTMLWGRYDDAMRTFGQARQRLTEAPAAEASVCGWQALAAYLADQPGRAQEILREGLALDPEAQLLHARLAVIPDEGRP